MSANIDERLVQMKFDNSQFESGAQQTLSTLDRLDKGLEFKNSGKGLTDLQGAMGRFNFGAIENGVASLTHSFSAFDVVAMTVINRITNKAIDAGEKIGKALTIQGAMDGFQEYELKMGSIQTILKGAKNKDGTAVSLDQVNQKLQELNTYSDRTIYSFKDMTDNIGKFTNAGVDLDTAVTAIQGIANEAALSGANAQEASRAMYNFSQALSSGYVKLIDWKSIENANMATVGFKQALLDTAVEMKTVEKQSDGTYKILTKGTKGAFTDAVTASKNFNDSLSAQWMTTEVLTKTLSKYTDESTKLGRDAFDAATEVKTFSQMMDTLKEAIGSGWAQSFELIIGDFDQAKKLWTSVNNTLSGIIDRQAKARNKLLEGWSKGGGRKDAIKAIRLSFKRLSQVVNIASEAMDHVFPDVTVKKLLDVTKHIKLLVKDFKMSDETTHNLYNTFKGFFSIIDIGMHGIKFLASAFKPLGGFVLDAGGKFLQITGNVGEFLDKVDKTIEKSDTFKNGISGIKDAVVDSLPPFDTLKTVVDTVGDGFAKFADNISKFISGLDEKGVEKLSLLSLVMSGFSKLGELVGKGFELIGKGIGKVKEKISELGLEGFIKILEGLLYGKLIVGLIKFIDKITNAKGIKDTIFDTIKEAFSGFKAIPDTLSKVGDAFTNFLDNMQKTELLDSIAKSIAILAASLFVLSFVDGDRIKSSLGGMTVLLIELIGTLKILEMTNKGGGKGLSQLGTSMIKMSVAVLILASALKKLTDINMDQLKVGLAGISALLGEMLVVAFVLSKTGGKISKGASSLIAFAVALKVMAGVVKSMSTLDMDSLGTGLAGVGVMLLYLVGAAAILGKVSGFGVSAGVGMIALATALMILSNAVAAFGAIDPQAMKTGIAAMTGVLTIVGIFAALMSKGDVNVAGIGAGLVIMSVGIVILTSALQKLGELQLEEIGHGLLALGGAMLIFIVVGNALNGMAASLVGISVAFLIFGAALNVMVPALQALGSTDIMTLAIGLGALAAIMIVFGVAASVLAGQALSLIATSIALGIFAAAILVLAPALSALASIGLVNIAVALGTLAAVLLVFGVASMLLSPVVPLMLLLSVAIIALGAACLVLGLGLQVLTAGIRAFGDLIKDVFGGLIDFLGTVFGAIGDIISGVGSVLGGIKDGVVSFFTGGDTEEEASKAVDGAAQAIDDGSSKVTDATDSLATSASKPIEEMPATFETAGTASADSLASGLGSFDASGVTSSITSDTTSGLDMTKDLNSLGLDNMSAYTSGMESGAGNIDASSLIGDNTLSGLDMTSDLNSLGLDNMSAYTSGMESGAGDIDGTIEGIGGSLNTDLASFTENFNTKGSDASKAYSKGLDKNKDKAESSGKSVAKAGVKGAKSKHDDFYNAGKDADKGMASGMKDSSYIVEQAAEKVAGDALKKAKQKIDSNSPSKEFMKLGRWSDEGFAIGLTKYSRLVSDASGKVAKGTLSTVQDTMARVYSIANDDSFYSPTITPIMDLSEIQNGANSIPGMLSGYSLSLANSNNELNNERVARTQANNLTSLFGSLKSALMNQQPSTTYNINGVTYDDGSNIANAMKAIANAAIIEGRM